MLYLISSSYFLSFYFSFSYRFLFASTVKLVLSGHSKIEETKVLKPCGSLIQLKSIAECSKGSILQYFWPVLSNNKSWNPTFGHFEAA